MSWKQYGGTSQLDTNNLNINTLSVDNIILRKAYAGNFDICGSLYVNTDVNVDRNLYVSGNSNFNNALTDTLVVNTSSDFYGDVQFHGTFNSRGNVLTQDSIESIGNTTVGSYLFMNNHSNLPNSFPYLYCSEAKQIGMNRDDANATLDIYSENVAALNVISDQTISRNILSQNMDNRGIVLSSANEYSAIDFFVSDTIDPTNHTQDGSSFIHVDVDHMYMYTNDNVFINGNVQLNGQNPLDDFSHIKNENLLVVDNCNHTLTRFYPDVYYDNIAYTANSATFLSNDVDNRSVTMLQFTNSNHIGGGIGAGNFPHDPDRAMMIKGLSVDASDTFVPTEIVVNGSSRVKYLSTTGINTYRPHMDEVVMDINGPTRIDNSDINKVLTTDFQVNYLNHSRISPNTVMAIGTSKDISGSYQIDGQNRYRHSIFVSNDYGQTWKNHIIYPVGYDDPNDNPNDPLDDDAIMNGDYLNQIDLYNEKYAFLTGNASTLAFTFNGGETWQNITFGLYPTGTIPLSNFKSICVQDYYTVQPTNFLTVYFTTENKFTAFDVTFEDISGIRQSGDTLFKRITFHTASMSTIHSIGVSQNYIFLAGSKLQVYTTEYVPYGNLYTYGTFNWYYIQVYDDLHAIAVGYDAENRGILSATINGGVSWYTTIRNTMINDVSYYNVNSAVAVGAEGKILITEDAGITWNDMPSHIYSSSGKELLISHSTCTLTDIVVVDPNTLVIAKLDTPYIQNSQYGKSFVYSCFLPKYKNHSNNHVLDLCGNMQIYGDIAMFSPGNIISSQSTQFQLLNKHVRSLHFAGDAANIYIGNTISSAVSLGGDLYLSGNVFTPGTVTCTTFSHMHENFSSISCDLFQNLTDHIDILGNTMNVVGNSIAIRNDASFNSISIGDTQNTYDSFSTISIGGKKDVILLGGNVSLQKEVQISGNVSVQQNSSIYGILSVYGNLTTQFDQSVNGSLSVGNIAYVRRNLDISGNLRVAQNVSIDKTVIMNGDVNVLNSTGILQLSGNILNNIGLGNHLLGNVYRGGNNIAIGNYNLTQNQLNGANNIGLGDHALYAITDGNHNIAMGKKAATSILTGQNNVAIGNISLGSCTTGKSNVAIGDASFFSPLSGDYNVAIGSHSMYNAYGGNHSISIGFNSGFNYDDYQLNNCVFIGPNSRAILPEGRSFYGATLNNSTAIGHDSIVTGDNQIVIGTSSDAMFISCPTVSIGKISTDYALDVSGIVNATNYNTSSDYRIKTNVSDLLDDVSVDRLRPISYTNISTGKSEMGFLAHELAEIFPDLVSGEKDGEAFQSVNYISLIPLLVKEIKDLKSKFAQFCSCGCSCSCGSSSSSV